MNLSAVLSAYCQKHNQQICILYVRDLYDVILVSVFVRINCRPNDPGTQNPLRNLKGHVTGNDSTSPYDSKIDVWALGMLLFELTAGNAPFQCNHPDVFIEKMKTKIYFNEKFDKQEISLIKIILRATPDKRPSDTFFRGDSISKIESISQFKGITEDRKKIKKLHDFLVQNFNSKKIVELKKAISHKYQNQTFSPYNLHVNSYSPPHQIFAYTSKVYEKHKYNKSFSHQHSLSGVSSLSKSTYCQQEQERSNTTQKHQITISILNSKHVTSVSYS